MSNFFQSRRAAVAAALEGQFGRTNMSTTPKEGRMNTNVTNLVAKLEASTLAQCMASNQIPDSKIVNNWRQQIARFVDDPAVAQHPIVQRFQLDNSRPWGYSRKLNVQFTPAEVIMYRLDKAVSLAASKETSNYKGARWALINSMLIYGREFKVDVTATVDKLNEHFPHVDGASDITPDGETVSVRKPLSFRDQKNLMPSLHEAAMTIRAKMMAKLQPDLDKAFADHSAHGDGDKAYLAPYKLVGKLPIAPTGEQPLPRAENIDLIRALTALYVDGKLDAETFAKSVAALKL